LYTRRLRSVADRLRRTNEELAVLEAELVELAEAMDDAQTRSIVSETPGAHADSEDARRHHDVIAAERNRLLSTKDQLTRRQDDLLDRLHELA